MVNASQDQSQHKRWRNRRAKHERRRTVEGDTTIAAAELDIGPDSAQAVRRRTSSTEHQRQLVPWVKLTGAYTLLLCIPRVGVLLSIAASTSPKLLLERAARGVRKCHQYVAGCGSAGLSGTRVEACSREGRWGARRRAGRWSSTRCRLAPTTVFASGVTIDTRVRCTWRASLC